MFMLLFPAAKSFLDLVEKDLAKRAQAKRLAKSADPKGAVVTVDVYFPSDPEARKALYDGISPYVAVGKRLMHG